MLKKQIKRELVEVLDKEIEKQMEKIILDIKNYGGVSSDLKSELIARIELLIRFNHDETFRKGLTSYLWSKSKGADRG
jgi:hypothetical protein